MSGKTPKNRPPRGGGGMPITDTDFPIVGLGASAGGLEAFGAFFSNLPADTGMAFVLVQHLDPGHASNMVELLKRYTPMPVLEATHAIAIKPNHAYMIPPNKGMTLAGRTLQLAEQAGHPGIARSIDVFFRSLAEELQERAIAIILSGTGTDGTLGAKAVKAGLGFVLVQEPETARYDGMPRAAIAAGVADVVLPAEKLAAKLIDYVRQTYGAPAEKRHRAVEAATGAMQRIFAVIRTRTRHDFSKYKPSTLKRRIERRMSVHQIENTEDYIRLLQENPQEVETLVKDFLINVTSFFRDPEAFAALAGHLQEMINRKVKDEDRSFRVWVVGCSTGEEAYSLAILLQELMERLQTYFDWQIFATDLDPEAIETARHGAYPESISTEVSPERLKKFFKSRDGRYLVSPEIREKVIFSLHDITGAPPFSRLDLLSARNLLIYLNSETQKKLIPLFHYSLNNGGILFLGTAETIGEFTDYFSIVDRKWRIYEARKQGPPPAVTMPQSVAPPVSGLPPPAAGVVYAAAELHEAERDLLKALPPSVLIDEAGQVLYVHGDTWKFLQLAEGKLTNSIMDMAREGVRATLVNAVHEVLTKGETAVREGARSRINGDTLKVRITVKPVRMTPQGPRRLAVVFEDVREPKKRRQRGLSQEAEGRIKELEQELQFTRENLRRTVEELETANEELRSANEEYQSTNEELHSANEELETSREELQSVNEELLTVNAEHQKKIEELSTSNDDMQNLLNSTTVATIFLDEELRIKRFTAAATDILNVIERDLGRPFSHITSNLKVENPSAAARKVLDNLVPFIQEVETLDGRWYSLRIHPYRTRENSIAGIVMSFVDINEQKQLQEEQRKIIDTIKESVLVLDTSLKITSANQAFYRIFQMSSAEAEGKHLSEISKKLDLPQLHALAESARDEDAGIADLVIECELPRIGRRRLRLNGHRLHVAASHRQKVLLVMEDVTEELKKPKKRQ